jgi:hypothetical protein
MNLHSRFSLGGFPKFAEIFLFLAVVSLLFGCQAPEATPASPTPVVELQILEPVTETPVPACVFLSDVELTVSLLSANSVLIKITGLIPNETVHVIFSSQTKRQEREKTFSGAADEKGVFTESVGLRGHEIDSEFKDWQIRVVHSRGSTCTEISLPEKQVP